MLSLSKYINLLIYISRYTQSEWKNEPYPYYTIEINPEPNYSTLKCSKNTKFPRSSSYIFKENSHFTANSQTISLIFYTLS